MYIHIFNDMYYDCIYIYIVTIVVDLVRKTKLAGARLGEDPVFSHWFNKNLLLAKICYFSFW